MREFHRASIPMGSHEEISGLRSVLLIETYMARKRMAYSALRKYVSLERTVLMGAFQPAVQRASPRPIRRPTFPFSFANCLTDVVLLK